MPANTPDPFSHDPPARGGVPDRALISELFISRKDHYAIADVLRLTRMTPEELDAAATNAVVAFTVAAGAAVMPWEDVAALAMERWSPRMSESVLARADPALVPDLNRFIRIEVTLPVYQIRLLHYLAERRQENFRVRLTASDVLEAELHDFAAGMDREAELAIEGFRAALHYPFIRPAGDGPRGVLSCKYCGGVPGISGAVLCTDCTRRHEPGADLDGYVPELDVEE